MSKSDHQPALEMDAELDDRRKFLASCGRFAIATPPVITALLSTSLTSDAVAHSGGGLHRDHDHHGHKHRGWFDDD